MPYLTPDEIPEDDTCRPLFIPDSTAFLAIVSGALTELGYVYNWEKFGTLTPEECAERMQVMIDQYYADACGGCEQPDGEPVIGVDLDGLFKELVNGEWVDPTGDYAVPDYTARTEPTSEERRCLASANAANVLKLLYEDVTDQFNDDISAAEVALTIGVTIGTLIAPPIGLLARAVLAIALFAFNEFFSFMDYLTEDVWGTEFEEKLKCMLYECSTDVSGVVLFDYDCLISALGDNTNPFDFTFTEFRLLGQVSYMLSIIGIQGLNLAGETTAITEAECECEDSCDGGIYLLDGNGYPSPWNIRTGIANYNCSPEVTIYDALNDRLVGCTPTVNLSNVQAEASYPATFPFDISSVHFVYSAVSTRSGFGAVFEIYDRMNTTPRLRHTQTLTQTANPNLLSASYTWGAPWTPDGHVLMRVRAGAQANSGEAILYQLTICP